MLPSHANPSVPADCPGAAVATRFPRVVVNLSADDHARLRELRAHYDRKESTMLSMQEVMRLIIREVANNHGITI
jgi:hypothetical protein